MARASIRYDGRRDMAWLARDDDSLDDVFGVVVVGGGGDVD